jgi:hypothetical protein
MHTSAYICSMENGGRGEGETMNKSYIYKASSVLHIVGSAPLFRPSDPADLYTHTALFHNMVIGCCEDGLAASISKAMHTCIH